METMSQEITSLCSFIQTVDWLSDTAMTVVIRSLHILPQLAFASSITGMLCLLETSEACTNAVNNLRFGTHERLEMLMQCMETDIQ